MKTRKILLGASVLALLIAAGVWLRNEVRIDSCLDRGGRWDIERQMCEGATE